jgi:hypothetical protein
VRVVLVVVPVVLLLAACAAGPNPAAAGGSGDLAGFWLGLWHGVISPVTFVVSLFTDQVNLYEVRNDGNWYDAGFVVGVSVAFSGAGGSGAAARRGRTRRRG